MPTGVGRVSHAGKRVEHTTLAEDFAYNDHMWRQGDVQYQMALHSINGLTQGAGSLSDVAASLRGIASDVTACSQAHTLVEGGATPGPGLVGPVDIQGRFVARCPYP